MVMEYGMTNTEKELLRRNVKELQLQLRDAHIRIKELNVKIDALCNQLVNLFSLIISFLFL